MCSVGAEGSARECSSVGVSPVNCRTRCLALDLPHDGKSVGIYPRRVNDLVLQSMVGSVHPVFTFLLQQPFLT